MLLTTVDNSTASKSSVQIYIVINWWALNKGLTFAVVLVMVRGR